MILALDLASVTGWACGEPGREPSHGFIRFAAPGASHEAIFASALTWALHMLDQYRPKTVVWESPLATSFGVTNIKTTGLLFGLPAIVGAAAYSRQIYNCRKADTRDVRIHFIGKNLRREPAKAATIARCNALGWNVTDDNEADALAIWHYVAALERRRAA
jgi:hypothetical protein